jgi:hypothetical protein
MTKRTTLLLALLLAVAICAVAADVTGKWVAQIPSRSGQMRETTFNFKVDGDKLTGTMSGRQGDIAISDGKVSGDTISFVISMEGGGGTVKMNYSGTVSGDEMKLKREGGQGAAVEFTAKRAK